MKNHPVPFLKKPTDSKTLIAILASCGALLIMIIILAVCASHHRKPYGENQVSHLISTLSAATLHPLVHQRLFVMVRVTSNSLLSLRFMLLYSMNMSQNKVPEKWGEEWNKATGQTSAHHHTGKHDSVQLPLHQRVKLAPGPPPTV